MFEWLEQEIAQIKTPRFHLVDGPAPYNLREAMMSSGLSVPQSYKEFVLQFGNCKLYRIGGDSYHICVYAGPRRDSLPDGRRIIEIGHSEDARVYIEDNVIYDANMSIYEYDGKSRLIASNFCEWLVEACDYARSRYGREKWLEILHGPAPFNEGELRIIEARKMYRWKLLGIDLQGNHIFEIINASALTLPVLTIGIRLKNKRLNGSIFLPVGHIPPGGRERIIDACYKGLVPAEDIEAFDLPDPTPEDRDSYRELAILR